MNRIILASASPRRKEILELIGLQYVVHPSGCEEKITETDPEKMVMELSHQKAADVAALSEPGDIVIGADTVVALDGKILGKPKSREHAFSMLKSMAGRTHRVYTGVTILQTGKECTFSECTEVRIAPMTDSEIESYLDCGEYRDKAGSYGIQGRFAPYITGINGDYYNVMGLPAASLYRHLKEFDC